MNEKGWVSSTVLIRKCNLDSLQDLVNLFDRSVRIDQHTLRTQRLRAGHSHANSLSERRYDAYVLA
jgi:hypothetical protein